MAIVDKLPVVQHAGAIRLHGRHIEKTLETDAASGKSRHHISLTVLIPERAGIDPAHHLAHIGRLGPFAPGIGGFAHHDSLVRHGNKHIVGSLVVADGGSPGAAAVQGPVVSVKRHLVPDIIDDLPVHQIPGMQQRHRRRIAKAGSNHKIVFSHTDCVRVGIIRIENGVPVRSVPLIRNPHFSYFTPVHSFLLSDLCLFPVYLL